MNKKQATRIGCLIKNCNQMSNFSNLCCSKCIKKANKINNILDCFLCRNAKQLVITWDGEFHKNNHKGFPAGYINEK